MTQRLRPLSAGLLSVVLMLTVAACATEPAVNKQEAASANASMGADFLHKQDNDQAMTYFRKALGYNADNFSANWGMAIANNRLGRADKAGYYYRRALDLQPGPAVYNGYGAFLCEQGRIDEALKYFNKAADAPQYAEGGDALANAGLCLYRDQQSDAAANYFRRALDQDPKQLTALTRMAAIEYARHNGLNARAFIERADAVSELDADRLLLGARIEMAMNDRQAAQSYLERYNASQPQQAMSLSQLEPTRP